MTRNHRPVAVTILAWLYIGVGTVGFFAHLTELHARNAFRFDGIWIELTELAAVLCGSFMLRGHNWARWLAVAWIALHVVLSGLEAFRGFVVHCLFCAAIAWILFRPDAGRYFRDGVVEPT
jgi:hypothetical protein